MRIRLVVRYTLITSIVLLVIMSVSAYLHIDKVQKIFLEKSTYDANTIAEVFIRDSRQLMLTNNRKQLQIMLEEIGKSERVVSSRILDKQGVVRFSTDKEEVGKRLDKSELNCFLCHEDNNTILPNVPQETCSRTFSNASGDNFLKVTRGIYNEPGCHTATCHAHPKGEIKLGTLDMVVSLDQMTSLARMHHTDVILSTATMLFILTLCLHYLNRKYIHDPIEKLLKETQALAEGDLSARVENMPNDEIGELGHSFNNMAENLAQAQNELQDWGNTLEQKVEKRTEEITKMQNQLLRSAKLASMGELVAGVAHEINNPLTGILMFASLSAKSKDLSPQVKENLDMIVSETGRCAKIVRGLLEFARESFPEKKQTSINPIIEQTLTLVSQQMIFQDVDIKCECCDELPEIEVDADQLQQVFFNMFINAAQAMHDGGVLTITTKSLEAENAIQIVIEDTGAGISPENLDKVFDPFFSTKSEQGFGLGLSVSYGIIQNHGGRVDVQSREGEGTRFTIYLPIVENEGLLVPVQDEAPVPGRESD